MTIQELCKHRKNITYQGTDYILCGYQVLFKRKECIRSVVLEDWQEHLRWVPIKELEEILNA